MGTRQSGALFMLSLIVVTASLLWVGGWFTGGQNLDVPTVVDVPPAEPGTTTVVRVPIANRTNRLIRCIGCSAVCGLGCTNVEGLPFEIPAQTTKHLSVEYKAPATIVPGTTFGRIPMDVFFDDVEFRKAVIQFDVSVVESTPDRLTHSQATQ